MNDVCQSPVAMSWGLLVQSFNDMTEQVAQARDETEQAHLEAENQRAYLETVLRNLNSGVISIDEDGHLRTANQAASNILNIELKAFLGNPITSLTQANPNLSDLAGVLHAKMIDSQTRWQEDVSYAGNTWPASIVMSWHLTNITIRRLVRSGDGV